MKPSKSSPSKKLKPMRMNTPVPMQKSIRFFIRMLPAFFARVKPVSTMAKPACIQKTSAAPIKNQTLKISLVICSSSYVLFENRKGCARLVTETEPRAHPCAYIEFFIPYPFETVCSKPFIL